MLSFPWKHNTFLAVYCTLLNKSYVFRYIFKEKQQKKLAKKDQTNQNGKKKRKKKKKEGRKKGMGRTRTLHLRLVATLHNHYTATADYVIWARIFLFYTFSKENPPANAVKDDRAA